jgi:eukaryotic-like serine/threonine-protein kinase
VSRSSPTTTKIGAYSLLRRFDSTLPEEVYLADSVLPEHAGQWFIVKVARRERGDFQKLRAAFIDSAQKDSPFQHKNVTAFVELFEDGAGAYLILEYTRGSNLHAVSQFLRGRDAALAEEIACYVAVEMLAGLHYVHTLAGADGKRLGLIVKNLTTPIVQLSSVGEVKIACPTLARVLIKRKHPVDPAERFAHEPIEWIAGEKLTASSNIYTVGVILFELLLGEPCFQAATVEDVLAQISQRGVQISALERGGVPDALCEIVRRATYPVPEHRFASAFDMAFAIAGWLKRSRQHARRLEGADGPLSAVLARFLKSHGLDDCGGERALAPFVETHTIDAHAASDGSDAFGLRVLQGRSDARRRSPE